MKLETLIEQNYHKLSENDLYIWEYIRTHPAVCRNISIDALSRACNISHTTILRFTRKLGLNGFSELKVILKWQENEEQPVGFAHDEIVRTVQDYQQTMEYIAMIDLTDLFTLLDQANKIYVYGSGAVQRLAALDLKQKFFHCNKLMQTIEGEEELKKLVYWMEKSDVMIFISLSGNNSFINQIAEQLKHKERTIVSICRVQSNRLIYLSDINIPFFTHPIQSNTAVTLWPINMIYQINEFLMLRYLEFKDHQQRGVL